MKKYIKATEDDNILYIDIDVYFALEQATEHIAATKILPLTDSNGDINDTEWGKYQTFAWCIFEILRGYDFVMKPGPKDPGRDQGDRLTKLPPPRSQKSYYFWAAHESQVDAQNVPRWIRVRISNHIQDDIDPELYQKHQEEMEQFLEDNKLPKDKQRQRYKLWNIVSDGNNFEEYEDVLNYWDIEIYNWMVKKGIDVSKYDKPDGSW